MRQSDIDSVGLSPALVMGRLRASANGGKSKVFFLDPEHVASVLDQPWETARKGMARLEKAGLIEKKQPHKVEPGFPGIEIYFTDTSARKDKILR